MSTKTTNHLAITGQPRTLRRWLRVKDRWLASSVLALLLVALISGLWGTWQRRQSSQPIIIMATPALPTPIPASIPIAEAGTAPDIHTTMSAPRTLPCAIIAYGAPDRATEIRAIEPGRQFTPTERISNEWLRAEVDGSGLVWMPLEDLTCLAGVPEVALPAANPAPAEQAQVVMFTASAPLGVEPAAQPTVAPPRRRRHRRRQPHHSR